jgi:hypothetical protein
MMILFWYLPLASSRFKWVLAVILFMYALGYPDTPLNHSLATLDWKDQEKNPRRIHHHYVTDEKRYYYERRSLINYLKCLTVLGWNFCPYHHTIDDKPPLDEVEITCGGLGQKSLILIEHQFLDPCGLIDPLMARLHKLHSWEPGHFNRVIPKGYPQSIIQKQNLIEDKALHEYYDAMLTIIHQKPLFSKSRLQTIWKMNTGQYDHLLKTWNQTENKLASDI